MSVVAGAWGRSQVMQAHQSVPDHTAWVADVLKRMQTVKPGMTRAELLKVFGTEGGVSNRNHRTYVSQDCRYFKVNVEFEAVGQPAGRESGDVGYDEGLQDRITKISLPFLQFSVMN